MTWINVQKELQWRSGTHSLGFNHESGFISCFLHIFLYWRHNHGSGKPGQHSLNKNWPRTSHSHMLFFSSLSVLDLCFSTNVTPKVLEHFLSEKKKKTFSMLFAWYSAILPLPWSSHSTVCWPSWLMTATWPSLTHYTIPARCLRLSMCAWSLLLMSMASFLVRWKTYRLTASPVTPMKSTISTVPIFLWSNWPVLTPTAKSCPYALYLAPGMGSPSRSSSYPTWLSLLLSSKATLQRRKESFFHMWVPPDSSSFLYNPLLYKFEATHRKVSGSGQDGGHVLHHRDPYAIPCDLWPQEQGCEGCIEKSNREAKTRQMKVLGLH